MLFDENITGTISLKLRKVPWDQAFVLVLKSKGLSYRRQGTVLRVASADRLVQEELSAIKLKETKSAVEPTIVKNFSINYASMLYLDAVFFPLLKICPLLLTARYFRFHFVFTLL